MLKVNIFHQLNNSFKKINFGILLIIFMSSIILLLFDKNFIIVLEEVLNILQKIIGIFSGCFFNTLRNTLSKN